MNILLNKMIEEKEIIEELINIDNEVMNTNYVFNDYLSLFNNYLNTDNKLINVDRNIVFITEGDVLITLDILSRIITSNKVVIFINQGFVGMNKWLINKYCEITGNNNIMIDTDINYNKYIEKGYVVIPIGESGIIDQVMEDFYDKE